MMKVLTGKMFRTTHGSLIIIDNQMDVLPVAVGDIVEFENEAYTVTEILVPSKPDVKWGVYVTHLIVDAPMFVVEL